MSRPVPKRRLTEADIESQIRDYLAVKGFLVLPKPAFPRGQPDILAVKDNRVLFVEIKRPDKRASLGPAQKRWQQRLEAYGCTYQVWTSLEEAIEQQKEE